MLQTHLVFSLPLTSLVFKAGSSQTGGQFGKIPFAGDDGCVEGVSAVMIKLRMVRLEAKPVAARSSWNKGDHRQV